MKAFFRSRGVRKFRRDKFAVAALAVICAYLAIAGAVLFAGLVDKDETYERVGPNSLVGFLEEPTVEQRLHYLEFTIDHVYSAADGRNPEADLAAIDLWGATAMAGTPEEIPARRFPAEKL